MEQALTLVLTYRNKTARRCERSEAIQHLKEMHLAGLLRYCATRNNGLLLRYSLNGGFNTLKQPANNSICVYIDIHRCGDFGQARHR